MSSAAFCTTTVYRNDRNVSTCNMRRASIPDGRRLQRRLSCRIYAVLFESCGHRIDRPLNGSDERRPSTRGLGNGSPLWCCFVFTRQPKPIRDAKVVGLVGWLARRRNDAAHARQTCQLGEERHSFHGCSILGAREGRGESRHRHRIFFEMHAIVDLTDTCRVPLTCND